MRRPRAAGSPLMSRPQGAERVANRLGAAPDRHNTIDENQNETGGESARENGLEIAGQNFPCQKVSYSITLCYNLQGRKHDT